MLLRVTMFVLISVGLGGFGLVAWISTHPHHADAARPIAGQPPPPPANRVVLVAAKPLRAGNLLKPEDIGEKRLPTESIAAGASDASPKARSALFGAMIRRSLAPDEPILDGDVIHPGDHGFLAAVLQPGMRAVTLSLNQVASDASLIWPGDHVDMLLTQQLDQHAAPAARRVFTETVLSDVRVLAIDQQLVEGATPDNAMPKGARTLTVEVTPEQAERLSVALHLGKLALSVRSAGPTTPADAAAAQPVKSDTIWAGDVSPALGRETAPNPGAVMRIWQGSADSKEFHF